MRWLRLYSEARTDAKLESLPDDEFRVWHRLLCFASEQPARGIIEDYSPRLLAVEVARGDLALLQRTLASLQDLAIISGAEGRHQFIHWDERQHESDNVAVRVARHRARARSIDTSRDVTLPQRGANVAVTGPDRETKTESETEQTRVTYSEGSTHERENARSRAGSQGADAPALSPVLSPTLTPALAIAAGASIGSRVSQPDAPVVRVQPRAGGAGRGLVPLPHPVAADLPAPSAPLALELSPPANPANPAKAARKPDVLWDACVAAMGSSPSNTVERGKWNKGLAALRESGATPDEITLRCGRYRRRFGPEVPLNPMALAGNWTQLAQEVSPHANQINQVRPAPFPPGQAHQGYQAGQAARSGAAGGRVPFAGRGRAGTAGGSLPAALRVGTPEYYDAYEQREAARRAEFNTLPSLPASAG